MVYIFSPRNEDVLKNARETVREMLLRKGYTERDSSIGFLHMGKHPTDYTVGMCFRDLTPEDVREFNKAGFTVLEPVGDHHFCGNCALYDIVDPDKMKADVKGRKSNQSLDEHRG